MNRIAVNEGYDGEIRCVLEQSGRYFYSICIEADFDSPEKDRKFLLVPISDRESVELTDFTSSGDLLHVNELLSEALHGRLAGLVEGAAEAWDADAIRFDVDTRRYQEFFRFPSIDVLAENQPSLGQPVAKAT